MPGLHLAHLTQAASMQLLHLNPIQLPLLLRIRLDRFVVSENRLDGSKFLWQMTYSDQVANINKKVTQLVEEQQVLQGQVVLVPSLLPLYFNPDFDAISHIFSSRFANCIYFSSSCSSCFLPQCCSSSTDCPPPHPTNPGPLSGGRTFQAHLTFLSYSCIHHEAAEPHLPPVGESIPDTEKTEL